MPRLPKAVEKQASLADQFYQQAYGTPVDTTGQAPAQPAPAPAAAPDPAPPADTQASSAPSVEPAIADQPKDTDTTPAPEEGGDLNHWRQRAKVAEGRLAKEMPRMAQSIRELKDQLSSSEERLAESERVKAATPANMGVKPEEVEQYGADFIDMVKRVASNANPSVDQGLKQQVEKVTEQQRRVSRQQFFDSLNQDAPTWEKLNTDQDFLNHLSGLDPFTGRPRQELFDDAYEKLDAWRIANFFNSFSESRQAKEPEPPKPSLANQVVPTASKSVTPPSSKKVWTTAEVARFYDDVRRGTYKGDEAGRIESDIFAAQAEGRLR